jgi:HAD superfamily hydrolase (TIGR01450 family)
MRQVSVSSQRMLAPAIHERLRTLQGVLLDMDGVLYRGESAIPGAVKALARLRRRQRLGFLTNNSTKERSGLVRHLQRLGFAIESQEIILVMDVVERHLLTYHRQLRCLVLAEDHVRERLRSCGITVVAPAQWRDAQLVLCGCRLSMSHDDLGAALNALCAGAVFISTNPDLTVDGDDGQRLEAGAYTALLAQCSGRTPLVIGKPEAACFSHALNQLALDASRVAMVGDNPDTDILGGHRQGLLSVHVLSGITEKPAKQADLVCADLEAFATLVDIAADRHGPPPPPALW